VLKNAGAVCARQQAGHHASSDAVRPRASGSIVSEHKWLRCLRTVYNHKGPPKQAVTVEVGDPRRKPWMRSQSQDIKASENVSEKKNFPHDGPDCGLLFSDSGAAALHARAEIYPCCRCGV
jgi:hypothetical protein